MTVRSLAPAHAADSGAQERDPLGARRRRLQDRLPDRAADADGAVGPLRGRTHRCKVLGIGHQRSRGVKGGAIVDLDAAENAIRLAVDAAERMAGVEVGGVIVNMSGGRLASQRFSAKIALRGKASASTTSTACSRRPRRLTRARPRTVLHALPTGFSLDATRDVRDPKGMIGDELGADLHVASLRFGGRAQPDAGRSSAAICGSRRWSRRPTRRACRRWSTTRPNSARR